MSSADESLSLFAQLALSADGAFAGVGLAYVSIKIWNSYFSTKSSLHKITQAPSLRISDLRSIISSDQETVSSSSSSSSSFSSSSSSSSVGEDEKLVVVRGIVEARSSVDGSWINLRPNVLSSPASGEKSVLLQKNQTYIYNEWRGLLRWTSDWRSVFGRSWKDKNTTSLQQVPFVLVERGQSPRSDYVTVDLDGSNHPLPLTTVYHQLQPVQASPPTFFQAVFGYAYPIGMLEEVKVLPLGKEISAVGICSLKDGVLHIQSHEDLPCYLSAKTKDQMVKDLVFNSNFLFWSGMILGSLSIGILSYASVRRWRKWKEWRQQRQVQRTRNAAVAAATAALDAESPLDDEAGDVPDGELCVVCLTRRRRSAFVPCGHMVCCQRCALSVQRDSAPKCPVCRQPISSAVRIYES